MSSLLPLFRRSQKSSESQDAEKKKSKGGFLNLIKRSSKADKSDKSQVAPSALGPSLASSATAPQSAIPEDPSSPRAALKSPAPETKSK